MAGTGGERPGTGGFIFGTNRGPVFWLGWAAYTTTVALIQLIDDVNTLRTAHDLHHDLLVWSVFTDGYSRVLTIALLYPAVRGLARGISPWNRGPWRLFVVHAAGAMAFAAADMAGYTLIRTLTYEMNGQVYRLGGLGGLLYEFPQELVLYCLTISTVWAVMLLERRGVIPAQGAPATFDIRDNARIIRAPTADILAVRAAGNYSEFLLADGRRILMRATLSALEGRLKAHGLARTHRSWLVNLERITEIAPAGSGDFTLVLPGGLSAPLSRRFRPLIAERITPS
jgi:hypothetical protein